MRSKKGLTTLKEVIKMISTIVSWTLFVMLVICAIFLFYYFISTNIYARKGDKYEPKISLYTIISPSMTPNINVYDVILDLRVDKPEDVKIGDVITFISSSPETNGMTITHRVISIIKDTKGNYSYKTKGDYSPVEDTGSVDFNSIIGKVAFRIPKLGRIQLFVASKFGWLFVVLVPALYIIIKDLFKYLRKLKDNYGGNLKAIDTKNKKILFLPYSFRRPTAENNSTEEYNNEDSVTVNQNPFFTENNNISYENESDNSNSFEPELNETETKMNESIEKSTIQNDFDDEEFNADDFDLPDMKDEYK